MVMLDIFSVSSSQRIVKKQPAILSVGLSGKSVPEQLSDIRRISFPLLYKGVNKRLFLLDVRTAQPLTQESLDGSRHSQLHTETTSSQSLDDTQLGLLATSNSYYLLPDWLASK